MKEEKSDMGDVMRGLSDFDENMVADFLEIDSAYNYLTEPAVRQAILELKLPSGSRGLEVGCGPGLHTLWLAEAVAPDGQVTGMDIMRGNLEFARGIADQSPLAGNIEFKLGDANHLPFPDDSFDWVWGADIFHSGEYFPFNNHPVQGVQELARVVKPGGIVAIAVFCDHSIIPGYPELEKRLQLAWMVNNQGTIPPSQPDYHIMRALGWFKAVGLKDAHARSFAVEAQAPLDKNARRYVMSYLQSYESVIKPQHLSSEDWEEYQRLCQPESPDFILNLPDYYCFLTFTLFYARVEGKKE